jgi:hypothetical protein
MPPKVFTLSEANALLPTLEPIIRRMVEASREFRASERLLDAFRARATMEGGILPDRDLSGAKAEADRLQNEIQEMVSEVEAIGCVLKDVDVGLVDFLSLRRGRQVYLCWRLGEDAIGFWHGLEEGYAGRKAIESLG